MFLKNLEVISMARSLARHAAAAQAVTARNIANADTPGFRAGRLPSFSQVWRDGADGLRATRAGHLGAGRTTQITPRIREIHSNPNENSVSLEAEMMTSALNRQSHDMALGISRSLGGVLRQTLSRR